MKGLLSLVALQRLLSEVSSLFWLNSLAARCPPRSCVLRVVQLWKAEAQRGLSWREHHQLKWYRYWKLHPKAILDVVRCGPQTVQGFEMRGWVKRLWLAELQVSLVTHVEDSGVGVLFKKWLLCLRYGNCRFPLRLPVRTKNSQDASFQSRTMKLPYSKHSFNFWLYWLLPNCSSLLCFSHF